MSEYVTEATHPVAPRRPLPDRIEALVWSVENRMGTHDDVLALDAIKLEVKTLEAQCADLEDIVRVHGIREDQLEAERDRLRAKVERLERERDEYRRVMEIAVACADGGGGVVCPSCVFTLRAALEGRGP